MTPVRRTPIKVERKSWVIGLSSDRVRSAALSNHGARRCSIALIVELFDTRLHDEREIADQLGVPVVGRVPRRAQAERAV